MTENEIFTRALNLGAGWEVYNLIEVQMAIRLEVSFEKRLEGTNSPSRYPIFA